MPALNYWYVLHPDKNPKDNHHHNGLLRQVLKAAFPGLLVEIRMVKGSNERSTYIKFTDTAQLPTTPATKSLVWFSKTVELKLSTPLQADAAQHATHRPTAPVRAGPTIAAPPPAARPPRAGLTTSAPPAARPPRAGPTSAGPPTAVTRLTASPSASL